MYRLVLYVLIFLAAQSILFGFLGLLSFSGIQLIAELVTLSVTCYVVNTVWAKVLKVAVNVESASITALILFFILFPASKPASVIPLLLAGVIAMSSKYIFAIHKKHVFNPAAIAAVSLGLLGIGASAWWIGTLVMIPTTLIAGLLVVRKIRRFKLFFAFLISALISIGITNFLGGVNLGDVFQQVLVSWPIIFFGTIMVTEPLTTPPTITLQILYGAVVGVLFGTQFSIGPLYSTPQLALVIGNIFSYIVSPKIRLVLTLTEKNELATSIYQFVFHTKQKFTFKPGQYMEWTFPHEHPDSRGNRRYFTIASSPTEPDIKLGLKFYENSSSYKKALLNFEAGQMMVAAQLAGDFTMPSDLSQKLVFIAGGIGITPFRSMIKYLLDMNQKRDIVLFFASKTEAEIVYEDIFEEASKKLNLKVIYVLDEDQILPKNWRGKKGHITLEMIKEEVPDFMDRMFYVSGPRGMVVAFNEILSEAGVKNKKIKSDFFPGFA